jgi:hypothetical protein
LHSWREPEYVIVQAYGNNAHAWREISMRKCHFCHGDIDDAAILCPHCGKNTIAGRVATPSEPATAPTTRTCPFCAEDIQHAAIVCKHCGRDLPAAVAKGLPSTPQTRSTPRSTVVGIIVAVVLVGGAIALFLIVGTTTHTAPEPTTPSLQVSGSRNFEGVLLTSEESQPLTNCAIAVRNHDSQWDTTVDFSWKPSQTIKVPWRAFTQNGHEMPAYLGLAGAVVTVECSLPGESQRHFVGLRR